MATSLNCPNCGAASGTDAAQCEYCGSVLSVMSCPACFGAMFVGMQFCPNCGAKGSRELLEETTRLSCPSCRSKMQHVRVGSTPMHECSACVGTWLSTTVFAELCMNREERGAAMVLIGARSIDIASSGRTSPAVARYLPCPECSKLMNRSNFAHRSGVLVDVCKVHGTWFERGELTRVLGFIEDGGLERSRLDEQRQHDEEQRELARELRNAQRMSGSAIGGHSSYVFHSTRTVENDEWGTQLLRDVLEKLLS